MDDIVCQICDASFKPMTGFEDTYQAYRCSSEIFWKDNHQFLTGHFGSTIADGKIYRVRGIKLNRGQVCDDCIRQMVDNRTLVCVSENNFW